MSAAPRRRLSMRRRRLLALRYVAAIFAIIVFIFPFYWLAIVSFKSASELFTSPPTWFPGSPSLNSYIVLFTEGHVMAIVHSIVTASVSTVIAMVLGTMAAYSLARFKTGGVHLPVWVISNRMIPPIAVVFPIFLLYSFLRWTDTYQGLILLYTAFNLPYVIWMMRGYIEDIPVELEHAALVDGYTRWGVLWRVVFPMAKGGIFATAVFTFIFAWNDFIFAVVLTRSQIVTYPVKMMSWFGAAATEWAKVSSMSVLASLPVFIVVATMQRFLVRGISMGAVKG